MPHLFKENYFISKQEKFPDIIEIAKKWTQNIEYVGVGSMRRTTGTGRLNIKKSVVLYYM